MEKWEALQILELDETATPKQIDKKFNNILRRIKNGENLDYTVINDAYDILTGREKIERNDNKIAVWYRSFMFHYNGWIVLGLICLIVVAMIVVPIFFRRIPDLTVSFAGKYGFSDDQFLDNILQENMPDVEDILVEVMYLDEKGESGEFDMGGRTRLSALLMTEEGDLLIVDDSTYNYIRGDNSLLSIDELIAGLPFDISPERYIYGIDFETGQKRIYGISVAGNSLVESTIYGATQRILCVAKKTGHLEEVKKAIEIILTYRSGD